MVFFIAFFGAAVGGFLSLILNLVYSKSFKRAWIIPALTALFTASAAVIDETYGFFAILGLFGLLVLLFLGGFFYRILSDIKEKIAEAKRKNVSNFKIFLWLAFSSLLLVTAFAIFSFGPIAIFGLFFLIMLASWLAPSTQGTFFKLQQILPTSKIRSLAMGLVEIKGNVVAKQQIKAPLSKKNCIGYYYTEHRISRDSEGKKQYRLISAEENYQPFEIRDETGSVTVIPDGLTLVSFSPSAERESGDRSYTEYTLFGGEEMMLIGAAAEKGHQVVIEKDTTKNILAISPFTKVSQWNKNRPLVQSALTFCGVAAFIIAIILSLPYTFDGHTLTLMFNHSPLLSWLIR
ncbi:Uncharacterised protein [Pragia fontium]|uniref:hypothetical protein n=1 Tax=Pragia fontium TaxID=82985 RepID=UPI000DF9AC75|nr:hypothetical protein [Pragia fontium]SUB84287.1 Uncharacterised protein [Pragia fontium]